VAAGGSGAASASAGSGSAVLDGGENVSLEGFARAHFSYGKKASRLKGMLQHQKEKLNAPLLRALNEKANATLSKKALAQFKNILCYCGDKTTKVSRFEMAAQVCGAVHEHQALADELLCQVCKQTVANPRAPSLKRAWELLALLCRHAPPSEQLRPYLLGFLMQQAWHHKQSHAQLAAAALRTVRSGGPITPQSHADAAHLEREIAQLGAAFLFGARLTDIMQRERAVDSAREVPLLVELLLERIITLGGNRTEGIFRIPGDVEFVAQCSFLWESGDTAPPPTTDPRAAASLLSLWLRSLAEPLVPADLYDAAAACKDPASAVAVAKRMPTENRALFMHMCKFFGDLAVPENAAVTKMNVPNLAMVFAPVFLRCPSDNPSVILQSSKLEHSFLTHAINGIVAE
jgi:Rho GTPase-activating protein 39